MGSIYEEVIKTKSGRTMFQERVEACLEQLSATSSYLPAFVIETEVNLMNFDFESTLIQLLANIGIDFSDVGEWRFLRSVEEPEFGPEFCVSTCFISGKLLITNRSFQDNLKWMSMEACSDCLIEVKPGSDHVGPLVLLGLGDGSCQSMKQKLSSSLPIQEYPPGVTLIPMRSRTLKPFKTINLVVFARAS